jgi:hypothetical protein
MVLPFKPSGPYHSAHDNTIDDVDALDYFSCASGIAFRYDITTRLLPPEYGPCDVFYSDLPWRTCSGFKTFNDRADINDGRTYSGFMESISAIVTTVTIPTILLTGPHAKPYLPAPSYKFPLRLNEYRALVYCFHFNGRPPVTKTAAELLHALAQRFDCIGDFCCGYGTAGRIFAQYGKRFVMSDFNAQCIGVLAQTLGGSQ